MLIILEMGLTSLLIIQRENYPEPEKCFLNGNPQEILVLRTESEGNNF